MPRLSADLGVDLWIARDDFTGLSSSGGKTPKREVLMAEAQEMGADLVITRGAPQSNHARRPAARLGMECRVLPEDRTRYDDPI